MSDIYIKNDVESFWLISAVAIAVVGGGVVVPPPQLGNSGRAPAGSLRLLSCCRNRIGSTPSTPS